MSRVERTGTRILGFQSAEMDFQLMRSLGAASFRGREPGEIFAARATLLDENPYAWPPAFAALAERVRGAAESAQARGNLSVTLLVWTGRVDRRCRFPHERPPPV